MKSNKRIYIEAVLIILVFVVFFVGLNYISNKKESEAEKKSLFKYSELLPDIKNDDVEIIDQDGGELYSFKIKDTTKKYYYEYCYALKENGFIDVEYETNVSFGAYTDDGKYWVETHFYSNDGSDILVLVQKSKNYKEKGE